MPTSGPCRWAKAFSSVTSSPTKSTALGRQLRAQRVDRGALVGGDHRQLDDLLALGDVDVGPGGRAAADRLGDPRRRRRGSALRGVHRDAGRLDLQPDARAGPATIALQLVQQPGAQLDQLRRRAARRSRRRTRSRGCRPGAPRWAGGTARPGRAAPGRRPPRRWSAAARPAPGSRRPPRAAGRPWSGPRRSARACRRSRRRPAAAAPGRSGRPRRAARGRARPSRTHLDGVVGASGRTVMHGHAASGTPSSVRNDRAQRADVVGAQVPLHDAHPARGPRPGRRRPRAAARP